MKRPRILAALVLIVVFVFGAVTGAGVMRAWTMREVYDVLGGGRSHHPAPGQVNVLLLDHLLGLSADQRSKVLAVYAAHWPEVAVERRKIATEVKAIRIRQNEEIRAILDDAQKAKFDEWARRQEERRDRALAGK